LRKKREGTANVIRDAFVREKLMDIEQVAWMPVAGHGAWLFAMQVGHENARRLARLPLLATKIDYFRGVFRITY